MSREQAASVGRWRENRRSKPVRTRTKAKKWTAVALLSAVLAGMVGLIVWLFVIFIFPSNPKPYFVPFWVAQYQKPWVPPLPWVDADRKAVEDGHYFPDIDDSANQTHNPVLQVMQTRLDGLARYKRSQPVVVYIASRALVDDAGQIQILAADSDPYNPTTLLSLRSVLKRLRKCPAQNKLLVLDVMFPPPDPLDVGGTADGVVDVLRHELQVGDDPKEERDPNLLVLCACSPSQRALGSETFGQSVFGRFLLLGLDDPGADTKANNRITVRELADYLKDRVDGWASKYRNVHQQPFLFGSDRDFDLSAPDVKRGKALASAHNKMLAAASEKSGDSSKKDGGSAAKKTPADDTGEKAKPEKGKSDSKPEPAGPVYPLWLAEGWKTRESWWQQEDFLAAPRVFRMLDALLLRAEERCRAGEDPAAVGKSFQSDVAGLQAEMLNAKTLKKPEKPASVGQARALGFAPDPALAKVLKEVIQNRRLAAPVPADQAEPARKAAVKPFLDQLKAKGSLDLAVAILSALQDERLDAKLIAFLDSLVNDAIAKDPISFKRDLVELRFLHQLAGRAAAARGEFSDDVADLAWDVACRAEAANNRPGELPWVRNRLTEADRLWHVGQVLLLPEAAGTLSWTAIADQVDQASRAYAVVEDAQSKLKAARQALARAKVVLGGATAYLEASGEDELALWLKAVKTASILDRLLSPPQEPLDREHLGRVAGELATATRDVDDLLTQFLRPFRTDSVNELVRKCESDAVRPDPEIAAAIDLTLQTPWLAAADRQRLWLAGRALDKRLAETMARDSGPATDEGDTLPQRVDRRTRRLAALVDLCGRQPSENRADAGETANPEASRQAQDTPSTDGQAGKVLAKLARHAKTVRSALLGPADGSALPDDPRDHTGWVAPIFALDWHTSMIHDRRQRELLAEGAWLGERYRHQQHDLTSTNDKFYETAVLQCPGAEDLPEEVYLEIQKGPEQGKLTLSAQETNAALNLQVMLHPPGLEGNRKATVTVLKSDDPRLSAGQPAEIEVSAQAPSAVKLPIVWDDSSNTTSAPPPAGLLVQARLEDGRTYHLVVPLDIVSERERLRLFMSSTASPPKELKFDRFPLRPVPGHQPYYLFVRNPSDRTRKVVVSILSGDPLLPIGETKPVEVPAHQVFLVQGLSATAPSAGEPPKPTDPLPPLKGPLVFRVTDADNKAQELDRQELRPEIGSPLDYLEIRPIQFVPAREAGDKNRLTVELRALPQMAGPACPVELVLPQDKELFPALLSPPEGSLSGSVEQESGWSKVFAENLALDPAGPFDGIFYLNVDGIPKAIWYKANFPLRGGPQRATEYTKPRVRFQAERLVKNDQPAKLLVQFTVANAPAGSRLSWRLRTPQGESEIPWEAEARRRSIGFDPRGPGGALMFEASVQDWSREFTVRGIRGRRELEARLIDPVSRKEYDRYSIPMVLDDEPPGPIALAVPPQVTRGAESVEVSAGVKPPISQISDATFFVGKAGELEKARGTGLVAQGRLSSDSRTWEARLPLPTAASGPILVTVQFTSGVGLIGTRTEEIAVLVPRPKAADPAAANANAPPAPGAIAGKVIENDIAQPGIAVRLYALDPNAKTPEDRVKFVKETQTGPDASYIFKDLKPGPYRVYCLKALSTTDDVKDVSVEAGKTAATNLDLVRTVRPR